MFKQKVFTQNVLSCTGINNLGINESEISLFPNPTSGIFTISLVNNENVKITVYNVLGSLISSFDASQK